MEQHDLLDQPTTTLPAALAILGQVVAEQGFGPHEQAVAAFVDRSRRAGVAGVALEVLADRQAAEVVRMRAMARLAAVLNCAVPGPMARPYPPVVRREAPVPVLQGCSA